jgi:molybdopterin synthase catalytic subunit/molybdopterin synthase sulfur carrier subunit
VLVTVRHFASLRETRGVAEERVDLAAGTSARAAYAILGLPARLPVAYAINRERVDGNTELHDGDELVFLPPLGGG